MLDPQYTCEMVITAPAEQHPHGPFLATCKLCGHSYRTAHGDPSDHWPPCVKKPKPIPLDQPPEKMRGLGDLVAKGLEAVGIKKKQGCGCDGRQETLNRWFPW